PVRPPSPAPPFPYTTLFRSIDAAQVLAEAALLLGPLVVGQGARVSALARRAHAQVEEASAQRLDLFAGLGAHVEAFHLRAQAARSEEHTSELQSRENLVCRL